MSYISNLKATQVVHFQGWQTFFWKHIHFITFWFAFHVRERENVCGTIWQFWPCVDMCRPYVKKTFFFFFTKTKDKQSTTTKQTKPRGFLSVTELKVKVIIILEHNKDSKVCMRRNYSNFIIFFSAFISCQKPSSSIHMKLFMGSCVTKVCTCTHLPSSLSN